MLEIKCEDSRKILIEPHGQHLTLAVGVPDGTVLSACRLLPDQAREVAMALLECCFFATAVDRSKSRRRLSAARDPQRLGALPADQEPKPRRNGNRKGGE